ncbi:MAG: UbiA family prenyltransferase [Candidatus Ozemobacteraceae bacterium]
MKTKTFPLCVDLDETLILSDIFQESIMALLRKNVFYLFLFPIWLFFGKAYFKTKIASLASIDPDLLPYNKPFLEWLKQQKEAGRPLWLCTTSTQKLVQPILDHLSIFTGVISDIETNDLSGEAKANELLKNFGDKQFDFCGNKSTDIHIWKHSINAITVNCDNRLLKKISAVATLEAHFHPSGNKLKSIIKAFRPHQWAKNILLFIPPLMAHKISDPDILFPSIIAFFSFGMCASSVYLLNDLVDLPADRKHPKKKSRPLASGNMSIIEGFLLIPLLFIISFSLAFQIPGNFALILLVYFSLTTIYSFYLKRIVLVDIICLAGLYTIRIVAGGYATDVPISFWLLLFSIFLFSSLAMVKRYAELESSRRLGKLTAAGRGYHIEDLQIIQSLGVTSGYLSILILALYINNPSVEALYRNPKIIWAVCILELYWISRVWLIAHRGKMNEDPVVFALKDPVSIGILTIAGILFLLAS